MTYIPIHKETEALAQSSMVELWEFDFTAFGGEIYRLCNQPNEKGADVVWQGRTYTTYPLQFDGFENASSGSSARSTLTLANITGLVTGLASQYNQLVGVTVIRHVTFAKFLDAVNFTNGNRGADPTQEVVNKFIVEQLKSLDHQQAALELAVPAEADGSKIPSRLMLANTCAWKYRGTDCGYTGRPVADRYDMPTSDASKDYCSGSLTGCKARFGETAVLPFGGFPSADKVM